MAVLKLQTVLAVSEDYLPLTHRPLIRWKAKLKCVAKEGKGVLRSHKKQILKSKRRNKSIWQGISRAAKFFVPFVYGAEELTVATVKRFERFADQASDFIKFVELGGGRCARSLVLSLPSLARSLGAGEAVERSLRIRSGTAVLLLQPWWLEEHDEGNTKIACLWISYDHDVAWEKSLKMMVAFYLSDSVDIMRVTTDCVDLLPSQFCTARAAMKELLAEMALHGRRSPAPSPLYLRFVRGIQNSHRYGFALNPQLRCSGGRLQVLDPILLACAHFYIVPTEKSNRAAAAALELVWHASPSYLPKKLSEHHEVVGLQQMDEDVIPKVANGFHGEEGAFDQDMQWWCPQSSTRLLVAPLLSPPRTLPQWCERQKQEHSTGVSPPTTLPTAGQFFQGSIKK
ncbi:unnamed protein product [Miscanthus lutarioriparius]|uniref:Uncharacterized protein n=1 Tax=Miscanthus lutarioriparius TaxID=422564 RepID=A0A811QA93_9POAL|nr:unnamed protein product [Miscanthus lutarioriparius]